MKHGEVCFKFIEKKNLVVLLLEDSVYVVTDKVIKIGDKFTTVEFSDDGRIYCGSENRTIEVFQRKDEVYEKVNVSKAGNRKWKEIISVGEKILCCDWVGDVFEFKDNEFKSLLGHLCRITFLHANDKYIVTGDKDGKIRVSNFERPYIIENYCLAHERVICGGGFLPEGKFISISSDKTMRLWDLTQPQPIKTVSLNEFPLSLMVIGKEIVVTYEQKDTLDIFEFDGENVNLKKSLTASDIIVGVARMNDIFLVVTLSGFFSLQSDQFNPLKGLSEIISIPATLKSINFSQTYPVPSVKLALDERK